VCVALAAAHARGLAYGRLTPANVLLTAEGRVKLHDFWMAQAARRSTASDLQADLQALGRCMVVMLTGREPPVGRPLVLGPGVPTELGAIVARALGGGRGGYRSAGDLGRDLVRFLATVRPGLALASPPAAAGRAPPAHPDAAVAVGPPPPRTTAGPPRRQAGAERARPPSRRRRRLLLLAGLVAAWLAVVALVAVPRGRPERPAGPVEVPATPTSALQVTGAAPPSSAAPATSAPATTAPPATGAPPVTVVPPASSYDNGRVDLRQQRVVPDVVGLDPWKAAEVLGDAGLRVRFVQVRTRWRADHQLVVAQDPPGGRTVPAGSVVTLALPRGRG
jgi:hypothetical protein